MRQNPPADREELAEWIRAKAQGLGFPLVGITTAKASSYADYVRQWLAAGRHGSMAYLARNLEKRLDPAKLVPGAKSVICVAQPYANSQLTEDILEGESQEPRGRIARYAWGGDYHKTVGKRLKKLAQELHKLFPENVFRVCVDTAPILERELEARAELGWIGKNTLLIHPDFGSYLLLGEIVTTLEINGSAQEHPLSAGHCGTCRRCLEACPTGCLEPYRINASKCISYLTIEHRGPIDPAFLPLIGNRLVGCDVCQEVCPFNHPTRRQRRLKRWSEKNQKVHQQTYGDFSWSWGKEPLRTLAIREVLNWSVEDRQQVLADSALKRLKLSQLKRNALIVAGNILKRKPDKDLLDQVKRLAQNKMEEELVRQTARTVLSYLDQL